jgi:hypothetical protein
MATIRIVECVCDACDVYTTSTYIKSFPENKTTLNTRKDPVLFVKVKVVYGL